MNIYVHKDGTQYGPYSIEQVQQYIQQGAFTLQDQACHDGQNWVPLSQVPGLTQPATAQPVAQQPQQVHAKQTASNTQNQFNQTKASTAKGSGKKVLIFASIGAVTLISLVVVLIVYLLGDDEENGDQVVNNETESEQAETSSSQASDEPKKEPKNSGSSNNNIPLIERIPSDAGAVILIRVNDLLEKGRDDIKALLPPGLPPMIAKALENPTSLGLDVSEPFQIHLIPNESPNLAPTGGLAGKLSDKEKFMNTIELLAGLDKPTEKDGYHLYQALGGADGAEPQIAVGSDFFYAGGADIPKDREPSIEKFMTADSSNALIKNQDTFASFSNEENDMGVWFGGDSILDNLGANLEDVNLDTLKGGSGTLTLNFEDGEMVGQVKLDAPSNDMVYGKGGFSDGILKFAPSDAVLALGFAFDLIKFVEYAEKDLLSEFGEDIKLDEAMPELGGLTIRDAISSFTGEFLASITDVKMPDPAAMGGFPGGPGGTEENPFGGDTSPAEDNPFGDDNMEDSPFPGPGAPGGFPSAGPPSGMDPSAMMMAAMPKPEFIVAASIDTGKWLKLKAAPPVGMGLGLAMMQGYSITEKNDFLLIASKDHLEATQSGSVKNPVSGSGKEIFEKNDFVFKINVAPILKMDLPIPPGGPMEMLKDISHLEMASNSGKTSGTGTMKLAFTDKNRNSLSQILKLIKAVQTIVPEGMNL
tara:strand:- start:130 stop:2232 length:2103 start_codon:yes stop_codon:yes gene_type:complete